MPRTKATPEPEEQPETDLVDAAREVFGEDLVTGQEPVFTGKVERPVIAKLAKIMANLPTLEPKGVNRFHNYNYIKDTQVSGAVRPRMAAEGLMLIPDVVEESWVETKTAKGGTSWVTKLKVLFTIIDAESGDSVSGHGFGYGDDSGDKGANKALTAAEKYFLMKLFQIGGEDLEDDEKTDERSMDRMNVHASEGGPVQIGARQVDNVAKGGHQANISSAQIRAIGGLVKSLQDERGWTIEAFITLIDETLGDALEVEDGQEAGPVIKEYIGHMTGDDAGKLLTALADVKDQKPGDEEDPSLGYGN